MDIDGIIAGRGQPGDRAKALDAMYELLKDCGAERDRIVAACPGIFSRRTKRHRAAFDDYETACTWVVAIFGRICQLDRSYGNGQYVKPTSA